MPIFNIENIDDNESNLESNPERLPNLNEEGLEIDASNLSDEVEINESSFTPSIINTIKKHHYKGYLRN